MPPQTIMKLNYSDKDLYVKFAYSDDLTLTSCFIFTDKTMQNLYAVGLAVRSRKDKQDHAKARKVAFTRAIATFDKEIRARFWKHYLEVEASKVAITKASKNGRFTLPNIAFYSAFS